MVILSVFVIQVNQVNSLTGKALTAWAPSINLGDGGAPIVSLSTDHYDRAVQREKNKRRTEAEEICTMTATPGTHTFTVAK